jgi:hypothetical protein
MENKLDKIVSSYHTKNPFKVPENYFAQFNEEIMSRLPEKEVAPKPKTVLMWGKVKPLLYVAAMLAGLYFCFHLLTQSNNFNIGQVEQHQAFIESSDTDNHWANVHITEEEFFQFIEEQLMEEQLREFMYFQFFWN